MEHAPYETVNGWIRNVNLNPKHLIPALLKYSPTQNPRGNRDHQGIRYLEYAIRKFGNRDPAVHNMLLSFYVTQKDNNDVLISFLKADVGVIRCFTCLADRGRTGARICSMRCVCAASIIVYTRAS